MSHASGIFGAIVISFGVGVAVYLITNNVSVAFFLGLAVCLFTAMLFTGLVYIRDAITNDS